MRHFPTTIFSLLQDLNLEMMPPRQSPPAGHGKAFAAQWAAGRAAPYFTHVTRQLFRQQARLDRKGLKDKNRMRRYAY